MPSGRSGGGSSHFGGSRSFGGSSHFGRSSFGGSSHFGGSHRSSGSSRVHMPSMRWRPHTTVIFGRPVYFGAGRATTSSLLSVLIVLAVMVAVVLGINWYNCEEDLALMRDNYNYYHEMAVNADLDPDYQIYATVTGIEKWKDSGKFRILYRLDYIDGYSFYVYDYETIKQLGDKVLLAIDDRKTNISSLTDSVPLDYKDTTLEDDAEYMEYAKTRDAWRLGTILVAGLAGAMFVISLIVSLTAKKATEEQIAETEKAKAGQSTSATAEVPNGTWRCVYCNALNDSTKTECDGCGAGRQK